MLSGRSSVDLASINFACCAIFEESAIALDWEDFLLESSTHRHEVGGVIFFARVSV